MFVLFSWDLFSGTIKEESWCHGTEQSVKTVAAYQTRVESSSKKTCKIYWVEKI